MQRDPASRIPQRGKSRDQFGETRNTFLLSAPCFTETWKRTLRGGWRLLYLRSTEGSCHRNKFIVPVGGTSVRREGISLKRRKSRRFDPSGRDNRKCGPEIPPPWRWNLSAMKSSYRATLLSSYPLWAPFWTLTRPGTDPLHCVWVSRSVRSIGNDLSLYTLLVYP